MNKTSIIENETDSSATSASKVSKPNLRGDWLNFFLLLLLYTVQGLPLGISAALPIIFQSKKAVTYKDQALFSFALWPYSLKLLWAPIVDTLYIKCIGRRKSWLIIVQYLMGACVILMANNINDWLPDSGKPNIKMIVCVVFFVNFLSATQDIVVDGWALTMLKKNNVSYSSTCNGVGLALGICIGSICPILLPSEDFCNAYLRTTPDIGGIITFKNFLYILGLTYVVVTTLIGIFKHENDKRSEVEHVKISVMQNYKLLWDIIKLPSMKIIIIALLTARSGYAAMDSLSTLKLIDAGVSKDNITIIATLISTIQVILPLFVTKYTSGLKPLSLFLTLTPIRIMWNVPYAALVCYTQFIAQNNEEIVNTFYYNIVLGFISITNEALYYIMLVAVYGFFSRISDPRFGGTYMTLFNTANTLGWAAPRTLALKLVDTLTFYRCTNDVSNDCSTPDLKNTCNAIDGDCVIFVDGYYVEITLSFIIGFVWYKVFKNIIENLQSKSPSYWLANVKQPNSNVTKSSLILTES